MIYDDDVNVSDFAAFYSAYGSAAAWADQTSEYGVGLLTAGKLVSLGQMPASVSETTLLGKIPRPPASNTIYSFAIPSAVKFDDGASTNACCSSYDGYHYVTTVGGIQVPYSITCECPAEAQQFGITLFEDIAIELSHLAVDTTTDPFFKGWEQTDDAHAAWTYATIDGELAELCEFANTANWLDAVPGGYAAQRTWSNQAAAAGHDPCVGDPTTPYYQTIPTDPDSASVSFGIPDAAGNSSWAAKGTQIALGATGTITMTVYSDDPASGPYNVEVVDYNQWLSEATPYLQLGTITGTFMPGDMVSVSAQVKARDPALSGGEAYVVETSPVSGVGPTTYYFALVVQ
ncbi:MAG TPA: hypothetical protein VGG74_30990 [Kofleriaceae bacterium]